MTPKQVQTNNYCEAAYIDAKHLLMLATPLYTKKLRKCTATVYAYETDLGVVFVLRSYNTIVAYVDENGMKYDFLRYVYGYTATSAQHIRKFFEDYGNTFTPAYTYKNS